MSFRDRENKRRLSGCHVFGLNPHIVRLGRGSVCDVLPAPESSRCHTRCLFHRVSRHRLYPRRQSQGQCRAPAARLCVVVSRTRERVPHPARVFRAAPQGYECEPDHESDQRDRADECVAPEVPRAIDLGVLLKLGVVIVQIGHFPPPRMRRAA